MAYGEVRGRARGIVESDQCRSECHTLVENCQLYSAEQVHGLGSLYSHPQPNGMLCSCTKGLDQPVLVDAQQDPV